ncbi:protein piccolo isoform X6 [Gouania willdenowi]|uniref:protein piccolo isoform X6 n=1 Tax=Gouania willdenowi TaxID=441366 RepID=UPI00105642BA|nr:protein piccolo-like isoform X6 [Gouania willdenowi]
MFSSKFLSGANPLNAVSSAVNKFGLFGDDGEGDKKSASQPTGKPPGEQKPGVGPDKDTKQPQITTKSSQGPPMQKIQPVPQPQGNGQTRALTKSAGPQAASKTGTPPGVQPPKGQPKATPQQAPPKQAPLQPLSTKTGTQAASPISTSPKVTANATPPQQGPGKIGAQRQPPGQQQVIKPASPGPTKARPQSKSLCPVCKTTEVNVRTKEAPNYKTCTQCKAEVCSLCGFSPPDSDGCEWLCLNCQIQRAEAGPKTTGPPMKGGTANKTSAPRSQSPSPAQPIKREVAATGSPQKTPPTLTKVPAKGDNAKPSDSQKQGSPAPAHKIIPDSRMTSGSQKPQQISEPEHKQISATSVPQQQSGGLFGFGGKAEAAKSEESVTGKMFGFGSSIFSSASSLMASPVQGEPKTTPPVSPKMQSTKDTKPSPQPSQSEMDKQKAQPQPAKVLPSSTEPSTCPICKTLLNKGSKNAPNYSTCTECKSTVCKQCGFNPMPNVTEGKEWLCLNCQVKRAAGEIEQNKGTPMVGSEKKMTAAQPAPQKSPALYSPQKKESRQAPQASKAEGANSKERVNASPGPKKPLENTKTAPEKQPEQKPDSGGLFGFAGPTSQPDNAKPAESVTGKMFGFGSSIFSSASSMISSATPPVSPKMSPAKESKSPAIKKQEKKVDQPQQDKGPTTEQPKSNQVPSEPTKKVSSSSVVSKAGLSLCPLCKVQLNTSSKNPPNYNTCTECKSTVCNQCGFNPMPNVKEVSEWLCLNCQMQRALGASSTIRPQSSPNKSNESAVNVKKDTPPLDKPQKKMTQTPVESTKHEPCSPDSPQKKPLQSAEPTAKTGVSKPPGNQPGLPTGQKIPHQGQNTGPLKEAEQSNQAVPKKSTYTSSTQENSGGFLGFGGSKPQPEAVKPTESLGGKMFGFGSSIFTSASTLISTAVQDEPKTTPPVSPKLPAQKTEEPQKAKTSPFLQAKAQNKPAEVKKNATESAVSTGPSTCPLCKIELNRDSKKPQNYNKCTECKTTVCDRCGFNPMPNMSEGKEWLCLNCQMQRALKSEPAEPPITPQTATNKTYSTSVQQPKPFPNEVKPSKELHTPRKIEISEADATKPKEGLIKTAAETEIQHSPTPESKTAGAQKSANMAHQQEQSKVPVNTQEPVKPPGSSAPKTGPEASKTAESIGGKMFGFGSSIFSSASTLISSAVQEESRTSPASSRKMSAPAHISPKMSVSPKISPKGTPSVSPKMSPVREPKGVAQKPEQKKKTEEAFQSKENKAPAQPAPHAGQRTCPLCKVELNIGSTCAPNYNTCTVCKNTVCNQCGFNPMPVGEVKEWLCLDCQMKRAVSSSEHSAPPTLKSQLSPKELPTPSADAKTTVPQKSPEAAVGKIEKSEQTDDQSKKSKLQVQADKKEASASPVPQTSFEPDQKTLQEKQKPLTDRQQPGRKLSNATAAAQPESGGFFGFGGGKPQAEVDKPTETVTGKMFGFGSSIFNSASTLITSSAQDHPKTTPPVSPKMSPAKDSKSPSAKKQEQEKKTDKTEQVKGQPSAQPKLNETKALPSKQPDQEKETASSQQSRTPLSVQSTADKTQSEPTKPAAQRALKPDQRTCPLCSFQLNMDSKNPPNYNTCTDCKNTVCNQCGFNPMPVGEVKEWLCLDCQMKRAVASSLPPTPPTLKSQLSPKKLPTPSADAKTTALQKSPEAAVGKIEKSEQINDQSKKSKAQAQADKREATASPLHQASFKPDEKTLPDSQQPGRKLSNATAAVQPESGGFFGFGGGKPQAEVDKPTETVTGKMFGFGSSIFNSASTLITSSAQDHPKTTPPVSPKMSPAKDSKFPSAKKQEQEKKTDKTEEVKGQLSAQPKLNETKALPSKQPDQEKETASSQQSRTPLSVQSTADKTQSEPTKPAAQRALKPDQRTCPLCSVQLNMGSKNPPNYNTCTDCKNTVCNQCGFNPMPVGEVKEWLCLDCQMKRAVASSLPPTPPTLKSQLSPKKLPTAAADAKMTAPQKSLEPAVGKIEKSEQIDDQSNKSKPQAQADKREASASPLPQASFKPDDKILPDTQQSGRKLSNATAAAQPESGGFFGFGGGKPQAEVDKPTETVTGKMFGFGSSIFNSASTLMTSSVQDHPKTTPPVSPKMSPSAKKEQEKKTEKVEHVNGQPSAQPNLSETKALPSKQPDQEKQTAPLQQSRTSPSVQSTLDKTQSEPSAQPALKPDQRTCPLCSVLLNMCSKDPPNYNTCTDCKKTVCNQCGFNPKPNETQLKQWLCLTCQTQRALSETQPPSVNIQTYGEPQKRESSPAEAERKQSSTPVSPQGKLSSAPQPVTSQVANKPVVKEQPGPVPLQEAQKTPEQAKRTEKKLSNAAAVMQKESGGLFGFGVGKTQPEEKHAESVTGKMFGFGSSIFSSASTLITTAVQDTPPVSPKMSPAKEVKSAPAQAKTKPEQHQPTKTPPKPVETAQAVVKPSPVTCPLCKVELNQGSKDPPNYSSCTECKNTVCNQCGFNPMPNVQQIKEWLCLTCQMQRALKAPESAGPAVMKTVPASADKETTFIQQKDHEKLMPIPTPNAPLKKVEKIKESTPGKDSAAGVPTLTKEEVIKIPSSSAPISKERENLSSDKKAPPLVQASPAASVSEASIKMVSEKKEERADQPAKLRDKEKSQTASNKELKPVEDAPIKTSSSSESEGFFGFGSPKTQRAASIASETVTGKMFGFGSSLISSASSLMTSAVQEDTVPSSRKMSAPVISGKVSPKPSPPISPRKGPTKEVKPAAGQKPPQEHVTDQAKPSKAPPTGKPEVDKGVSEIQKPEANSAALKVNLSTCPLCKMELNLDSNYPPNYNTCTDCKTIVCCKCGFSPMLNVTEVKEWLCLTCQMQRALGASEPPGLPMMKAEHSPSKEVPAPPPQKNESTQADVPKPKEPKKEPVEVPTAKESGPPATTATKEPAATTNALVSNKTDILSTMAKMDILECIKGQQDTHKPQSAEVEAALKHEGQPSEEKVKATSEEAGPFQTPAPTNAEKSKPSPKQPAIASPSPAPTATPPAQPTKQDSGGFFNFGAPKTPPTAVKSAESVKGKMFGFGSSFLNSASTLISSAVQDETKTTPLTAQTQPTLSSVPPKTTSPVSPKMSQLKDTKPSLAQKPELPKQANITPPTQTKTTPPTAQTQSTPSSVPPKTTPPVSPKMSQLKDTKLSMAQKPEPPKQAKIAPPTQAKPTPHNQLKEPSKQPLPSILSSKHTEPSAELSQSSDTQDSGKAVQSCCPLCKIKLNKGSKDPPNFNTCTECKATVCTQCGFNPMPNVTEVKEWLCLNCQVQRALGASDLLSTPEKPKEQTEKEKELSKASPQKKETPNVEIQLSPAVEKTDSVQKKLVPAAFEQRKAQDVAAKEQIAVKSPQVQRAQTTKGETNQSPAGQENIKPPQQLTKPEPAQSTPVAPQPKKQESPGGFFGFGGPKPAPTAAKPAESVTGKMFGFGSSFLSSASTLITSTVQDEPKTTPPTQRKLSTPSSVSPKTTPPVSPKMPPAKETKPPIAQKPPQQDKPAPRAKAEKLPKSTVVTPVKGVSTCPLCKVTLNKDSEAPPNHSTCTECKSTVCNQCGFNPSPHTAVKEWLCLNCQTQRALSGQLAESTKPDTPVATSPKKIQPQVALTKAEPTPTTPKSQPLAATVEAVREIPTAKAEVKSAAVKMQAMAMTSNTQPMEVSKTEPSTSITGLIQQAEKKREETIKNRVDEQKHPKSPESTDDIHIAEIKAVLPAKISLPETEDQARIISQTQRQPIDRKDVVQELYKERKDMQRHEKVTEPKQSLQQDVAQNQNILQNQKVLNLAGQAKDADSREVHDITDVAPVLESEPVSSMNIMIQDENENTHLKISYAGQDNLRRISVPETTPKSKDEEDHEDQPQILPIPLEVVEEQTSDSSKVDTNMDILMAPKEEIKTQRRHLSFQPMDESSDSELTPSPKQRKILQVTNLSSSSEDIKTESGDSSVEDEEFIREQIMGMGSEDMSDKEKGAEEVKFDKEVAIDNALLSTKTETEKVVVDNKESVLREDTPVMTDTTAVQNVPETMPRAIFKKAVPVLRQRQSPDEEVESFTESLSKGSSSVQVSSFTPESSHTSASSLEEDSDSSPSHRKSCPDKQHRKGKHRQSTHPLPTIEDSSDEEKIKTRGQAMPPFEASSKEDLKQVMVMDESHKTSGSEHSASIESETEFRQAVQRGRKPSPTVIPYTPDPDYEKYTMTKPLKSAEETYEEIIQKTKAIPGDSPPDVEPLYGGMSIEDYLYESLVEDTEFNMEELKSPKKLRSPEEVYEEMMQRKKELVLIEQEFHQAQTAMGSSVAETCVVTIPPDETGPTVQTTSPPTSPNDSSELSVKKKKRPAPPRPTEPPKRPDVTIIPSTPTGSISFVRPMIPQDPALRKALFPIPDLKITQCSSGEDEEDSLADEYGMGISSDITPSDDSEPREELSTSPPLSDIVEMEPICVICEIPEPKPIPTPISAPELTATSSPVSTVSPPTSPTTPDSSLASNATSSSSFQVQTPPSSDSTPLSTPTPPTLFRGQSPPEMSLPDTSETAATLSTVIVTIPDVVTPFNAQTTAVAQIKSSSTKAHTESSTDVPVMIQMPDLVSTPSQITTSIPSVLQVSAPGPAPIAVSAQPAVIVTTSPVAVITTTCTSKIQTPYPRPVIVQMPDVVSTSSSTCVETAPPLTGLITTTSQSLTKLVHSVPVQPTIPPGSTMTVQAPSHPAQALPTGSSTTIIKKKVPPPPPPRSTSVSLPESTAEQPFTKTDQHDSSTTSIAGSVQMQSVVVDIQPRLEKTQQDDIYVPKVVTQTRQGHIVIIVPSAECISQQGQTTIATVCTASTLPDVKTKDCASDIPRPVITSLTSSLIKDSAPPLPPKPETAAKSILTEETTVSHPPKPIVLPKPSGSVVTGPTQTSKPPPPIPPKPTSIPAGLVFSHKPGESIKPPRPLVAPKAATLPRTKEPPNALSLSLTRPVESKGMTSPKSPLSPRHGKCLQTYVVITLPSELGSPPETITVQAPLRRGSIPSTKVSGLQTTDLQQKTHTDVLSAQAAVRRASVPDVKHQPPIYVAPVESDGTFPTAVQPPHPLTDVTISLSQQDALIKVQSEPPPVKKPYVQQLPPATPQPMCEIITVPPVKKPVRAQATASIQSVLHDPQQQQIPKEVFEAVSAELHQDPNFAVPVMSSGLTEVITVRPQSQASSEVFVINDRPAVQSHFTTQKQIEQTEQELLSVVVVPEVSPSGSRASQVTEEVLKQTQKEIKVAPCSEEREKSTGLNNTQILSGFSPAPEHIQFTHDQSHLTEVVTEYLTMDSPTEVITSDIVAMKDVPTGSLETHPVPVVAGTIPALTSADLWSHTQLPKSETSSRTEVTPSHLMKTEIVKIYPEIHPATYTPHIYGINTSPVILHTGLHEEAPVWAQEYQPIREIVSNDTGETKASISATTQPQTMERPFFITEETNNQERTSISSVVQPPNTSGDIYTYPVGYEEPSQVITVDTLAVTSRELIKPEQPPAKVVSMQAERDVTLTVEGPDIRESVSSTEQQPQILTYSSEYECPLEIFATEAYTRRSSIPTLQDISQDVSVAPVTITKIQQESIESQEIRGPEKVVSSMSHMYASSISTSGQPPENVPSRVTQVVTTEVQRTTVSVVHEKLPQGSPSHAAVTVQPDTAIVKHLPTQDGKIIYPGDVIDLRTMKAGIKMTEQGMDLTPPQSGRLLLSCDPTGRQSTAVLPNIVNLSADTTPATTLSVVTDSITIVTCTATLASYNNTPAEKPLDLQGPVVTLPLPLTTYKPFEPLAQIIYRPVNSQPVVSAAPLPAQDLPINLSYEAFVSPERRKPIFPAALSDGGPVTSLDATGAIDLSNYKSMKSMVVLSDTSPGVVTTVVEDDGTPVDLTAGRRSVCCDVIYKLPFTGSCRTQPPVTTQPDNRFGYRDDYYHFDNIGMYGNKGTDGIKSSVSETNLIETGLSLHSPRNDYEYISVNPDAAVDLTGAKLSAGELLDYTSKSTGLYPAKTTAPYSHVPAAGFGVNNALRTSDGIVYSSVSALVPSTYAITTQPGSVFSTTLTPTSTVNNQLVAVPYGFVPTTAPGQIIPYDSGLPPELLPTALADIITGYPEMYSDTTLEAIAASLDALVSSPLFPGLDNTKMAQYQMEREFLQLEKLKQLCLAEELEWERQEIQRYREQEQLMVQQELEELQALKQQLLLQQEEEHQAHMVAQQETYAQQKEQLQQIQQLQLQLQRQLDEHYGNNSTTGNLLEAKYAGVGDSGQYWPVKDESTTPPVGHYLEQGQNQHNINVNKLQAEQDMGRKIIDSGVQTDEDSTEKPHVGRRKKSRRDTDSSAQTDDEDQDEWDAPTKARRRSRKHSSDGKHGSKVCSIAIQTVAEISVQTDHSGSIKRPNVQMDTKVEIIKHISAPENSQRGGSLSCQTDLDGRLAPIEVGYSTHLSTDASLLRPKVFYNQVSPLSPEKSHGGQRMLTADPSRFSSAPRIIKLGQKSLSDPKSLGPSTEDRMRGYYADTYSGRVSPSGTSKKVKRTLPDPPPENDSLQARAGYSTNSARRRLARSTTMARAKILQDIDKELDLVERESSKLRKKQAELDEEEKEIDAKLRYLEMGINRRKEALLKEREKRERDYLQGVAEERDYMSDSEVSNIRESRNDGLERPHTAPQSEFDQFIPPQTEADSQYNTLTSPYSHYAQYVPQTQTTSHYTQQNLYNQQSLYHQQVSPYTTLSLPHGSTQPTSYQHALLLQQGKQRQTSMSDLEHKTTANYEVIRNQPLLIVPTSSESGYGVTHLGGKYGNLDLRLGLEERSMASSPMSSVSADSFYAEVDNHNARNYVLIEDIGELTKASTGLSNTGLGSGFTLPDKELSKADRLLRAAEVRRTAEVADFLGTSRLQGYGKSEDDTMEEPYELKLLKQQIKQEFRRGTEGLEHLTGIGLPQYLHGDSSFRQFPKGEKYSIGRLTLEKQAAKQLPAAMLYQKQMKNKKAFIDPKAITKFSPIQESRDIEPEFGNYMGPRASSVSSLAARARILQDEITFGLRKNLSEQQKYLGSSLGANLSGSVNLGQSLALGSTLRATVQDDGTYPSGSRSRPSSRPSSVYGLDLSIKRDLSSSSLRLKTEGEILDAAFAPGVARAKPTSLPISQSRGRIPIVAQNSEEESPLSPVGQPMGMARASAGPLPPISADSRDQFGSSHSLPEVQQHMREESRTRGYDRDIAFIMDDMQGAMSDSEAYHLRREDTDWFDKPREGRVQSTSGLDRRQMKLVPYAFPHTRINLKRDSKDTSVSGNGLGIRVVGGKDIPGSRGEIGAYVAKLIPGGVAEQTGKILEGMQVLEWNGVLLMGKTYEEVQCLMAQPCAEAEICVRLDLNMLSDPEHPQALEHHIHLKAGGQRSPGVDPNQLAAELHKVSQQQAPGMAGAGLGPAGLGVLSALDRSSLLHSGTGSVASSGVPSPGQPTSPAINKKQRHKPAELMPTPLAISGEIQLQINYDRNLGNLIVHVLQARNLSPRDNDGYSDPFVKVYLLPGRGQVMVVQNASAENKRRTKYAQRTLNPEWNQTVIYKNIHLEQLKKKTLEVTVWDYDRSSSNDFLGEVLIDLSNTAQLDNTPRWLPLREQSESIEHSRAHHMTQGPPGSGQGHSPGQGHMSSPGHGLGHGIAPGQDDGSHDSPKNSVIKSRSHGIFPDPGKGKETKHVQMLPLEKSHSSPGSSKSSSDGQLRSHGPSRSQSKSSVTQAHLEDAGIAIAAAEAAVQQSRLQPRPGHRLGDVSGSVVLSAPSLVGDAYGDLDGDEGVAGVDSAIFQVPRIGKAIPNGTDKTQLGSSDNEGGKTQVMGEIKVALKKEVKTEGDQLVLEILQCRNITYKFKSPDHLPDLYVKLYVVNVATQRRIIKKKTRVCRHDREPSFNETFRFPLNPTGHSIQLFLVSNGGKFLKKTLIGEAYIWLDKVDMRKRVVSWHKLFVSSTQTIP